MSGTALTGTAMSGTAMSGTERNLDDAERDQMSGTSRAAGR